MNKTIGLILASVFLISTLGIIPGLMLTTEAAIPPSNPTSPIYTVPKVIQLPNTSTSNISVFFNIYSNSTVAKVAQAYDFGLADNYTADAITFTVSVPSVITGTFKLTENYGEYAYFYYNNASVAIVLSPIGPSSSPFAGKVAVSTFEINTLGVISNLYNYTNGSVGLSGTINVLSLNYIINQATGGKYPSLSSLPAGSTIQISYAGYTNTITVIHVTTYPAQLVNPLEVAGVIPNPGYVQAVGRSNVTIGVYDPAISAGTTPFNFTLTYTSQAPAVITWFVIANTTNSSKYVTANFYAPEFVGSFLPYNNSVVYEPSSQPPFLQFNGNLNVTAHENITGTLQTGTNIYVGQLNVTPPGNYYFSGQLSTIFNGYVYTNGSATLKANIFNGTVFFFLPKVTTIEYFRFFITPVLPINVTSSILSPLSSLVIDNGMKFYVGFPSLIVAFTITTNFTMTGGNYVLYGSVNESEINPIYLTNITNHIFTTSNESYFIGNLTSATYSPLVHYFNFGESTTTILGTSLSFTILQPLKFITEELGYVFLVIFHIWGPSATVIVTGVDYHGDKITTNNFRAYIALPTYYTTPPSSIDYLTCDNQYTLVQVKDPGSVLDTIQNNVMFNNASIIGPWDKVSHPPLASYYAAGLHIAVYNGTKLKFNTTIGPYPNATTTPVSFTISLQGQTVPFTYSTIPSAVYPVAFKFEPGTSYMVTTNLITNTSVPEYVVTIYTPLQYLLNTKIVLFYVSPDFATLFYYNTTGQFHTSNVTISFANVSAQLVMPPVFPVSKLYMPFGVNDSYYEFYDSISMGPINGVIELTENGFNVGNITSMQVMLPSGVTESIVLSPLNVSKLLVTTTLGELSQCSPVFEGTVFNITELAALLELPTVSALNGSYLMVTYHDAISGAYVTGKTLLTVGAFYVTTPVVPGSVEWILTAHYINATTGVPVEISYAVVQQPEATVVDLNAANISTTSVVSIPVVNVQIVSQYATAQVVYNPSNSSTIVYMDGMFVASYTGNLLPTLTETGVQTGEFFGPVVNLYVAQGSLSSPNGTMYIVLGPNKVAIGSANLYTYAGYHFGPYTALPVYSNVTFTVEDPVTHGTLTGMTTLGAFNNTPIRISPLGVTITPSATNKVFYYYTSPLVLSPTSQYIVVQVTSTITYSYPFYIETVVFLGYNVTTGTPVPGTPAFQTVYSPTLGPGVVLQVPIQTYQVISLSTPSEPHTVVMFAVPFAGGPAISLYPSFLVYTNVTAISS